MFFSIRDLKHLVTFSLNVQSLKLFDSLFAGGLKVDELNVTSSEDINYQHYPLNPPKSLCQAKEH